MFKLIRLNHNTMVVIHKRKNVYWCGTDMDAVLNIMSDLKVDYTEVQAAMADMKSKDNNCADFGEIRGTFIYSERKTMREIDAMIPGEVKERPAC